MVKLLMGMAELRYKFDLRVAGPLVGWLACQFTVPWWLYLIAIAVFLIGLVSFSLDRAPGGSGYAKRADDSRGHGAANDVSGGGDS